MQDGTPEGGTTIDRLPVQGGTSTGGRTVDRLPVRGKTSSCQNGREGQGWPDEQGSAAKLIRIPWKPPAEVESTSRVSADVGLSRTPVYWPNRFDENIFGGEQPATVARSVTADEEVKRGGALTSARALSDDEGSAVSYTVP